MKFVLVAGEASGDALGANLILALKKRFPQASFAGIGGAKMIQAGLDAWFEMEMLSVMGFAEVLGKLPGLLRLRQALIKKIQDLKPDIYIGIDAPDFNLGIESQLKESGILTVHYVSPSIWAWRYHRIFTLKEASDLVLCLFPFEASMYEHIGHPAVFVGHPLAYEIPFVLDATEAKQKLNLSPTQPLIAILPGSRMQEVRRLLPLFLDTFALFKSDLPEAMGVIPVAHPRLWECIRPYSERLKSLGIFCLEGRANEALNASDIALVASGTASLEAMLYRKPTVVAYKLNFLTYLMAKAMVHSPYIALPNILATQVLGEGPLMSEWIQENATSENLARALISTWETRHDEKRLEIFEKLHRELALDSGEISAQAIARLWEQKKC